MSRPSGRKAVYVTLTVMLLAIMTTVEGNMWTHELKVDASGPVVISTATIQKSHEKGNPKSRVIERFNEKDNAGQFGRELLEDIVAGQPQHFKFDGSWLVVPGTLALTHGRQLLPEFHSSLYPSAPAMPPLHFDGSGIGLTARGPSEPPMSGPSCIGCSVIPIAGGCGDCTVENDPPQDSTTTAVPDIGVVADFMALIFVGAVVYWWRKNFALPGA